MSRSRCSALAAAVLAALFYFFFMSTKHNATMATIIPFGEDPWDAIGSYCMITSIVLAVLSLWRAIRPVRNGQFARPKSAMLARTQLAIPAGILVTLATDAIAMARHPAMWAGKAGSAEVLLLMTGLAIACLAAVSLAPGRLSWRARLESRIRWWQTLLPCAASAAFLAVYPEGLLQSVVFHFFTILAGFVLIAAPQAALVAAFVPYDADEIALQKQSFAKAVGWVPWFTTIGLGIGVGAFAFAGELSEDGQAGAPLRQAVLVALVFLGAGAGLILIAFGFLRRPLGLFRIPGSPQHPPARNDAG